MISEPTRSFKLVATEKLDRGLPARDLLREAVERPEPAHDVAAVETLDTSTGEAGLDDGSGPFVFSASVRGQQHDLVADVEIAIGGWEPVASGENRSRHGQLEDLWLRSIREAEPAESVDVLLETRVVFICWIMLRCRNDRVSTHESREVVNVSVGIVTGKLSTEPDDF